MSADHRWTAAAWHGGQGSRLYAYSSTGTVLPGLDGEIEDCLAIVERGELDIELDLVDEHERLMALLHDVEPALAKQRARDVGRAHGQSAAAWWEQDVLGGRATGDTTAAAARMLRGIEDGDPAILDEAPGWDSVANPNGVLAEVGWREPDRDDRAAHHRWAATQVDILDAYATAFVDAYWDCVAEMCRSELAGHSHERSEELAEQDLVEGQNLLVRSDREQPVSEQPSPPEAEVAQLSPTTRATSTQRAAPAQEPTTPASPFIRAFQEPDFDRWSETGRPAPPGWTTEHVGPWDGREIEVVFDPRRHEVMVTMSAPTPDVVVALEASGWEQQATAGQRSFWVRDRVAATRAALARLDSPAACIDRTAASAHAPEPTGRPAAGPGLEL